MPGSPFRSKLVPFEDLIRELRAAHTPYRDITKILKEKHGVEVHADTINSFVIVRAKRHELVYTLPPKRTAGPVVDGDGASSPALTSTPSRAKVDAAKTKIKAKQQKRTAPRDPGWEQFAANVKPGPLTLDAKTSQ